jgi:hypothetical protein
MLDDMTAAVSPAGPPLNPGRSQTEHPAPLRPVHTRNFSAILRQLVLLENSFVVPDAALADLSPALREPAEPTRGAAGSGGNGTVPRQHS